MGEKEQMTTFEVLARRKAGVAAGAGAGPAGSKAGEVVPAEPVETPIVPAEDLENILPPRQAQE